MRQKIVYEASDGKQFETKEECAIYEGKLVTVTCFNANGEVIKDTRRAWYVYLKGKGAARAMLKKAREEGDDNVDGIEDGMEGLFAYDGFTYNCIALPRKLLALSNVVAVISGEKVGK